MLVDQFHAVSLLRVREMLSLSAVSVLMFAIWIYRIQTWIKLRRNLFHQRRTLCAFLSNGDVYWTVHL